MSTELLPGFWVGTKMPDSLRKDGGPGKLIPPSLLGAEQPPNPSQHSEASRGASIEVIIETTAIKSEIKQVTVKPQLPQKVVFSNRALRGQMRLETNMTGLGLMSVDSAILFSKETRYFIKCDL